MLTPTRLVPAIVAALALALTPACKGDGIPDDPGINGANLPSGGSPTNPAGKYVGHFLTHEWDVEGALADAFNPCRTDMVYVDGDLNLVVGDENDDLVTTVIIPLEEDGATYSGSTVRTEDDARVTIDVALAYDTGGGGLWEATVNQSLDEDGDGTIDATGQALYRLEPRLDWSSLRDGVNGAFDGLMVQTHLPENPAATGYVLVGGGTEQVRRRFLVDGEGALFGQGPITWFYEGPTGPLALVADDEPDTCHQAELGPVEEGTGELVVNAFERPKETPDVHYVYWDYSGNTRYHLYGDAQDKVDFAQNDVVVTAKPGSQIDHDTDGEDEGSGPYYYWGSDMASALTASITLQPIADGTATITPPPGSGDDPFAVPYGYVRAEGDGYVVMNHAIVKGTTPDGHISFETIVMAVDDAGQLTGDGLIQGYDFPMLDSDVAIGRDEWRAMDNEGLLMFGDGIAPDAFDFVVTRASVPTVPD